MGLMLIFLPHPGPALEFSVIRYDFYNREEMIDHLAKSIRVFPWRCQKSVRLPRQRWLSGGGLTLIATRTVKPALSVTRPLLQHPRPLPDRQPRSWPPSHEPIKDPPSFVEAAPSKQQFLDALSVPAPVRPCRSCAGRRRADCRSLRGTSRRSSSLICSECGRLLYHLCL
jgi:hypothetical protein